MGESDLAAGLAKAADRVVNHMNDDHLDSILAYAHFYAKMPDATSAKLTGLNEKGFVMDVVRGNGDMEKNVLVPYNTTLKSPGDLRKVAVSMHQEAYNGMGITYKLARGYYSGGVKQVINHTGGAKVWVPVAMLAVAAGYAAWQTHSRRSRL
eukprot:TRINITY_DN11080_c0_g1_i1.p1 TRINITY_DN11080_c0_g1~~TRINITY_DN11080_c0_g1_i1.p1  ORF type:complete len:152 (-),score=29.78 TRINITY_DN11080_c0_g1_i1:513-968(-)